MTSTHYNDNVFINCPFDSVYKPLFDAIVFAVHDCGFVARCALEEGDASQVRIDKIYNIIENCRYGIHDISRTELDEVSRLPRFNMPLELGIFLGAKRFGVEDQKGKKCLVMDKERFRYQKFISDIAGQDIRGYVNIHTWEDYSPNGKFVIQTICEAIDDADLFFADLTGLNANVMFELGYAIARDKRIWLIFDNSFTESTKMFNQLKILTTIGYHSCQNSNHIVSGFYKDKPFTDTENTIFRTAIKHSLKPGGYHSILHLKSKYEDQAAIHVSNLLRKRLPNRIIVDDPRESTVQSLTWYGSRVFDCSGVICHFTNPKREGAHLQTARHALVCGMAHGFEIPLLMLAEDNFLSPIDYREFLRLYNNDNNARIAAEHLDEWLPPVEEALKIRQNVTGTSRSTTSIASMLSLRVWI